jgi:hypothetical protein
VDTSVDEEAPGKKKERAKALSFFGMGLRNGQKRKGYTRTAFFGNR